jgi:hypothetical protein
MFKKLDITNAHRHRAKDKIPSVPFSNLFKVWPFENKPMPYASWVQEQIDSDPRYQSLDIDSQGQFLRLATKISAPGMRGRFDNPERVFIKLLGLPKERADVLLSQLLSKGLLLQSDDLMDYVQPELREQCLIYCAGDSPQSIHPELWDT